LTIAVLMASHNRRSHTIDCLSALFDRVIGEDIPIEVILVDDGSTDGTAEEVRARFPDVRILSGSGALYWSGAIRLAIAAAMQGNYTHCLLLNDDTNLYPHALSTLVRTMKNLTARDGRQPIVVGTTEDPEHKVYSYGGRKCLRPGNALYQAPVAPDLDPRPCDTFNGNCVLIPAQAMRLLGNLDPAFSHGMGDFDLGLRARNLGIAVFVAPGFVGACRTNSGKGSWLDETLPVGRRWRLLLGPKGLPPKEWLVFTSRHAGALWPIYWLNPYLRFWVRAALGALGGNRRRTRGAQ
jgi:GT2 family glycosyltransferase